MNQVLKWGDFRNAISSSVDISKPNTQNPKVCVDLERFGNKLWINGVKLSEIASSYNNFKSDDDAKKFLYQHLLQQFSGSLIQKIAAVKYLMETFHQGGLLCPVSTSLATSCIDKDGNPAATTVSNEIYSEVRIRTTKTGFKIHERCSVMKMMVSPGGVLAGKFEDDFIKPVSEQVTLIMAEATLNIDFTPIGQMPSLTVESNRIKFFHPEIEKLMDRRSLVQMIVDFFSNLFNCDKVPESNCGEINVDKESSSGPTP